MPGCCCTVQPRNAFFSLGVTGEPRYIPDLGTRSGTRTTSRHFGVLPLQPHRTALPPPDIASPRRPPLRASYRAAPPGFALLGAGAGGGDGGAAHGAGFIARPQRRPQPGGAAALTELRAAPRGTAAQRRGLTANRPTSPGGPRSEPGGAERREERRGKEERRRRGEGCGRERCGGERLRGCGGECGAGGARRGSAGGVPGGPLRSPGRGAGGASRSRSASLFFLCPSPPFPQFTFFPPSPSPPPFFLYFICFPAKSLGCAFSQLSPCEHGRVHECAQRRAAFPGRLPPQCAH